MLSENTIHKAGRIDQVVSDYFRKNTSVSEITAKALMQEFIDKDIFNKDYSRPGLPIRNLIRLDAEGRLSLFKLCKVVRQNVNRSWYFTRT